MYSISESRILKMLRLQTIDIEGKIVEKLSH
jgi:hypothetical protein